MRKLRLSSLRRVTSRRNFPSTRVSCAAHGAWGRDGDRMVTKVRHLQIAQKNPTVGVRVGAHATGALRCQSSASSAFSVP